MQSGCGGYEANPLLQFALQNEIIRLMPESRRPQDEIARRNLVYVIEACSKRLGRAHGGQAYLARLLGSTPQYVSAVVNGHDGRNLGRDHKTRIEELFKLDPGWMDAAHDGSAVDWLLPRVPSIPRPRKGDTRAFRPGYGALVDKILELERQISELKSLSESGSKPRK